MDPTKITELATLLRNNGDKILNSEFNFTLSGSLLRALNDSFTLIADATEFGPSGQTFQVVKPINSRSNVFRDLQLVHDFVQKTAFLCIMRYSGDDEYRDGRIDITKFRNLRRLEVHKTNVLQIVGLQPLRAQIQQLICVKSLETVDDIITHCGGDNANGFVWNALTMADFSYNQLQRVDTALEFAQYLQHLNLRHNQLSSVEAIKWLPHLLTLDLSYNRLTGIPQFHLEACKRLQLLNMSNNLVEDLLGISKLDTLRELDLSDNCLLDHNCLLPLSVIATLTTLSLYGNPLHCHPKHRLAAAQFLHKNAATMKFILDYETLTRAERNIAGSKQLRRQATTIGAARYGRSKSNIIIGASSPAPSISSTQITPSSSVGSQRSFKLIEAPKYNLATALSSVARGPGGGGVGEEGAGGGGGKASTKKRTSRVRNVEIADNFVSKSSEITIDNTKDLNNSSVANNQSSTKITMDAKNFEHLTTKQHIETLRKKYGNEWLQTENAKIMQNVLGLETISPISSANNMTEKHNNSSRQLFQDFLGEFSPSSQAIPITKFELLNKDLPTSTPVNASHLREAQNIKSLQTPNKSIANSDSGNESNAALYVSANNNSVTNITPVTNVSLYKSANEAELLQTSTASDKSNEVEINLNDEIADDDDDDVRTLLKSVYPTAGVEESLVSEGEEDEETYIVYTAQRNESMFLTISSNFLREKDTLTQKTKNKWSLKILESCDRIKSNTLRINFDTVKVDKQERVYTIEDGLCLELEKKLRDILSQRNLCEMNQTIYRCVNCTCQFSQENKKRNNKEAIRCPNCKSNFVAEIHDIPKSLEKANTIAIKLSPAAVALPPPNNLESEVAPLATLAATAKPGTISGTEDTTSIGSANSLNGSSSVSKISNSHHSQSSFDSNQSVVGSTTAATDFRGNCESDIDIISNPSISSIEVLDVTQYSGGSRKASEERRIMQTPSLETIEDHSYRTQNYLQQISFNSSHAIPKAIKIVNSTEIGNDAMMPKKQSQTKQIRHNNKSNSALAHINLTESSSSGSVTDSVCTAYEQPAENTFIDSYGELEPKLQQQQLQQQPQQILINNIQQAERLNSPTNNSTIYGRKDDSSSISSMFGALIQSTNILMSSSKKLLDAEAGASIQAGIIGPSNNNNNKIYGYHCPPYKFNYTDFNDVDHRLKLYFYQTKFEDAAEHFKWLVRGHIFNANTHALCLGIVVMSTCKLYAMEVFAPEHDDVTKWLRPLISVTVDRLESIQLLPWKIGLSFRLRDWGNMLLLLQDILRTDSLLLHFANNSLPHQCELRYQASEQIVKRIHNAVLDEKLKMLSLLNGCEIKCENARRTFKLCGLLTTDTRLYLTSGNLSWLCSQNVEESNDDSNEIELCITQFMSNLVEVERPAANIFTINFLDETQDKYELWKCVFETKENAESCFNAIGQSWEMLFGVPLFTSAVDS